MKRLVKKSSNQGYSANIIKGSTELSQQVNQIVTKNLLLSSAVKTFSGSFYNNQFTIAQFYLQRTIAQIYLLSFGLQLSESLTCLTSREKSRSYFKREKMISPTNSITGFLHCPPYNYIASPHIS